MLEAMIIKSSSRGYDSVRISDEFLGQRKIFLSQAVDAETMNDLFQRIYYLETVDPGKDITLFINSPGGEVVSGLAVIDLINSISSKVNTVCIGTAASMGAMLFLSGKERIMLPHTKIMIHDPSYGRADMSHKKPDEIEEFVKDLKKTRDVLVEIIAKTTGKKVSEIKKVTKEDSYFDAKEAVEFGLATAISKSIGGIL